jgi:hypothetical protein
MSMSKINMVLRANITVLKAIPKKPAPQITIFSEAINYREGGDKAVLSHTVTLAVIQVTVI